MKHKTRIELTDNIMSAIIKMAEGNPGAAVTLAEMVQSKVDPDAAMGGLGNILLLDTWGIYGSDIYILHNDICNRDMTLTCAVLRATQLGLFDSYTLKEACSKQDRSGKEMVPAQDLYIEVVKHLPNFDKK